MPFVLKAPDTILRMDDVIRLAFNNLNYYSYHSPKSIVIQKKDLEGRLLFERQVDNETEFLKIFPAVDDVKSAILRDPCVYASVTARYDSDYEATKWTDITDVSAERDARSGQIISELMREYHICSEEGNSVWNKEELSYSFWHETQRRINQRLGIK